MILSFFMNYSPKNKLGKRFDKVAIGYPGLEQNQLPCEVVYPCSLENPVFRVGYEKFNFRKTNYLVCDTFDRNYFIDDVTLLNHGIVELHCSVDALETFGADIKNTMQCIVERQEFECNPYIPDPLVVGRIDRTVNKRQIGAVGGNATGTHFTLTVTGGLANA